MAIPVVKVTVRLSEIVGTPMEGARVAFNLTRSDTVAGVDGSLVPAGQFVLDTFVNGEADAFLFPNALGTANTQYGVQVFDAFGQQVFPEKDGTMALAFIPAQDCLLHSILFNIPPISKSDADAAIVAAQLAVTQTQAAQAATELIAANLTTDMQGFVDEATNQVSLATAQVGLATDQAGLASGSAQSAADQYGLANQSALDAAATATAVAADRDLTAGYATAAQTALAQTNAIVATVGDLGAARDTAVASAATATAARDSAADLVLQAQVPASREYGTLALALADAALVAPARFTVRMQSAAGNFMGTYYMQRTATGHQWLGMRLAGALARQIEYRRAIRGTLAQRATGLYFDVWGSDGWEWDGRVIPNRIAAVPPTLNAIPDPIDPLNELASNPAREPNTLATLDSAGTNYALKLTASAQNQQLKIFRSTYTPQLPSDTYRLRVEHKTISGGTAWKLGSTSGLAITAGPAWSGPVETVLAAYTGATDVGISSATGNVDGVIAIGNLSFYDPLAGDSALLPTFTQELAAQKAGHMKRDLSVVNAFALNVDGSINIDGTQGSPLVTLDPVGVDLSAGFTMGGIFDCTQMPAAGQGLAFGFDNHATLTNGANGSLNGQFGVYGLTGLTSATAYRIGKPYVNPNVAAVAGTPAPNHYLIGQGFRTIFMTVAPNGDGTATQTLYINEVPWVLSRTMAMPSVRAARMLIGAWNNSTERHKVANPWVGKVNGLFLSAPLTQAGVEQQAKYMIQNFRLDGGVMAPRKVCWLFNGDSLTGFSPSFAFHLSDKTDVVPRLDAGNTAIGGTKIGDALTDPRHSDFITQIGAAVRAGYEKTVVIGRWGTNEVLVGTPYSWIAGNYTVWRDQYFRPFVTEAKAQGPAGRIEWWHVTQGSSTNINAGSNDPAAAWTHEQLYLTFNDDFRANYMTYGVDKILDLGLGTERMTGPGTFAPEVLPGGRLMANWRCNNAAKITPIVGSANRVPAGTLTLSAASGAAITATASNGAGTFLWHDLYRRIVAGAAGYGRIIAISADGSQVTLDTTDNVPPGWVGENALTLARDSALRGGGFDATFYAAAAWSIQNCVEEWLNDGTHQGQRGGRNECDYVAPSMQALLNSVTGYSFPK